MHTASKPARVGILGGMGPAATADFYRKLVQATPAVRDQDHIPVLMEADPSIPDRSASYLHGGPSPLPLLVRGARALEAGGAELIAMPCNTAHLWYDEIVRTVRTRMLHIVDAVVAELASRLHVTPSRPLRVGVLGTAATASSGLYPGRATRHAIAQQWRWVLPHSEDQSQLVEAGIAAVKSGDMARARSLMARAQDALARRGVDAVVHACTEVPLALAGESAPVPVCDSTDALAQLAVREALGFRDAHPAASRSPRPARSS